MLKRCKINKIPLTLLINSLIGALRSFLTKASLYEVHTSVLSKFSGIEPFIDPLVTQPRHEDGLKFYLRTSPEFSLKKTLSIFYEEKKGIFEIAHVFRDERINSLHHIEFTMAEWYIKDFCYLGFIEQINQVIRFTYDMYHKFLTKEGTFPVKNQEISLRNSFDGKAIQKISVKKLFEEELDFSLKPNTSFKEYQKIFRSNHLRSDLCDYQPNGFYEEEWGKMQLFQILFDHFMTPVLKKKIYHIYDFPPFIRGMAALSQAGWAQRVECYIDGIEISNGYQEMSSSQELMELWRYNNEIRKIEKKEEHPMDELLIETTPKMKGVAGISLGLERILTVLLRL